MTFTFSYEDLDSADFISGAIYESGGGGFAKEPLHVLFRLPNFRSVGTQSGIRRSKVELKGIEDEAYIVIVNTHSIDEWKNSYNKETNILTYYGDNRTPGNDILNTKQRGNLTFKKIFNLAYGTMTERKKVPPIFYFERTEIRSDMRFVGLAIPYVDELSKEEALVKNLFQIEGGSFENYIAKFTILPNLHIQREWLHDLKLNKKEYSPYAPEEWIRFVQSGILLKNDSSITPTINESPIDLTYTQHTKEITVSARLTQNKFKKSLLSSQKACQICGLDIPELLIASHIKPWRISADDEKIDLNNGLLLCPNHDKLFDRNLISFDHEGKLLISKTIKPSLYEKLLLSPDFALGISEEQEKYLAHHRQNLI